MNNNKNDVLDINNLSLNIFKAREAKQMTRAALAEAIGLSGDRIIYDYENGVKTPRLTTLISICIALDVEMDSLLRK